MDFQITEDGEDSATGKRLPLLDKEDMVQGQGATKEQVELLEREIQEQEKLLAGYQQENER